MNKTVDYFMHPQSPWTCLGHDELHRICALHNADIRIKPIDLGNKVFPVSGGVPLAKRAPQRQDYRFVELERWRAKREVAINLRPRFFPANADTACRLIIAADRLHGAHAAFDLAGRLMRATWCQERDVADDHTLRAILHEAGMPADPMFHAIPDTHQVFDAYTQEAMDRGVFGVPWYVFEGTPYWGQDRLEFLERALAS